MLRLSDHVRIEAIQRVQCLDPLFVAFNREENIRADFAHQIQQGLPFPIPLEHVGHHQADPRRLRGARGIRHLSGHERRVWHHLFELNSDREKRDTHHNYGQERCTGSNRIRTQDHHAKHKDHKNLDPWKIEDPHPPMREVQQGQEGSHCTNDTDPDTDEFQGKWPSQPRMG